MQYITLFLKVFQYFGKSRRKRSPSSKVAPKHSPNATKMLPRASQEPSRRPQDRSKSPLGMSWPLLGHSEASEKIIKLSKNHQHLPKCVLIGPLGLLLGAHLALLGVLRPLLKPRGRSLAALGALLGRSWATRGRSLAISGALCALPA